MSDQRIDTGADAATSTDADPAEGQGIADPGAHADPLDPEGHRTSGADAEMPQPTADRRGAAPGEAGSAATEGASGLQQVQRTAESEQRSEPDLGGREPAGARVNQPAAPSGAARPAPAETGEVSAPPSPQRRAEDPGSMATEFGDRADSAPEDDVAHPSI
ncbi:MAG: hypothetical protein ACJ73E_14210 [Mycobacteriales bacterium]